MKENNEFINKKYVWCFMGQLEGRPTRKKMIKSFESLSKNCFTHSNSSWQSKDMINKDKYLDIIKDSIFVPCPRGNKSVDSFRFFETLESGSIPIVEEEDGYWEKILGENPLIKVQPDWSNLSEKISELLNNKEKLIDYSRQLNGWWINYKNGLLDKVSKVVEVSSDQKEDAKRKEFVRLKKMWSELKNLKSLEFISDKLKYDKPSPDKFSKYNEGKKIAFVMLYTPEIYDFSAYSEENIKDYCYLNNYTLYVYRDSLNSKASPNWSKSTAILNHIRDHDYIVWIDADCVVLDKDKKIEKIIRKSKKNAKIIACEDIGKNSLFNSGVVIFKNHSFVINIINSWNKFDGDKSHLYASGGDQEVLIDIIKSNDFNGFNTEILDMNEFNTDPRMLNEDSFILHFMAYPLFLKKIFIYYCCSL